jgi:hypothetical protein
VRTTSFAIGGATEQWLSKRASSKTVTLQYKFKDEKLIRCELRF